MDGNPGPPEDAMEDNTIDDAVSNNNADPYESNFTTYGIDEEVWGIRSDYWSMPRRDLIGHTTILVGTIPNCGRIVPDNPETNIHNMESLFFHYDLSFCGAHETNIRYFTKIKKNKKPAGWRLPLRNGGIVENSQTFKKLHGLIQFQKRTLRTCYEIDKGSNVLKVYLTVSSNRISDNLAVAAAEITSALSQQGQRCPAYTWNQALLLAYPNLDRMELNQPRVRWNYNGEYIPDPESGEETDDESQLERKAEDAVASIRFKMCMPYDETRRRREPKVDFEKFYDKVAQRRVKPPDYELCLEKLTCVLRPYQIEAVQFMINREVQTEISIKDTPCRSHKLAENLHYFPELGVFCRNNDIPKLTVTGGILADEMGLGKTVELLALIFSCRPDNMDNLQLRSTRSRPLTPVDPVREVVDYLVSTVVAQEDGIFGLHTILKSKLIRPDVRNKNVYFNTNSRHYQKYKNIEHLPKINCSECGVSCLKNKMHWKDEFTKEGIQFVCPDCIFAGPNLPSAATLIIVPQVLIHQWFEEIRKHVREDVQIDVYLGVEKDGFKHPVYLSRCDIVITSYEVLRHELEYCQPGTLHNLRKRTYEQQRQVTTPLISINWWRICLDESQMIEGCGRLASQFVAKLNGRARWCVTGTPLIKGPDDIYGLVCFLELYPFTIRNVWLSQLWYPYCEKKRNRIADFVGTFFWRNTVKGVQEQLNLPPITQNIVELHFSPLEERLYQEQLGNCLKSITEYIERNPHKVERKIASLSDGDQRDIMGIFNRLRLYVLTGGSHIKKKNNKMTGTVVYSADLLFKRLFMTHRMKLEERIREYVYAMCALGGLTWLYVTDSAALDVYLKLHEVEVIMAQVNEILSKYLPDKKLLIDRTQMVHFCRAMLDIGQRRETKEMMKGAPEIYKPDALKKRMKENEKEYTRREIANLRKFYDDWNMVEESWERFDKCFECCTSWILVYLDALTPSQSENFRNAVLQTDLSMAQQIQYFWEECRRSTFPYRTFFFITDYLERIQGDIASLRRTLIGHAFPYDKRKKEFVFDTENEDFRLMLECQHNAQYIGKDNTDDADKDDDEVLENLINQDRTTTRSSFKLVVAEGYEAFNCPLCDLERSAIRLELELQMRDGDKRVPLDQNEWYTLLKELSNKRIGGASFSEHIKMLWKWFEQCRKTVLMSHKVIVSMKEVICRYRELKQAQKRLEINMEIEMPNFLQPTVKLTMNENDPAVRKALQDWRLKMDETKRQIIRIQTQINYVTTLNQNQNTEEERMCPVCFEDIGNSWNVYPCAHFVCVTCFGRIRGQMMTNNTRSIHCVTCRAICLPENVIHVISSVHHSRDPIPGLAKGQQLNVKYDAIVRKLLEILQADITNKVLIFSSLTESLESFCAVLQQTGVRYNRLFSLDPLKIASFRNDANIRVLIIPMHTGASGLNLTQANHVFFLEPSIEKATVAQAIGRMARMGQTRPMTVHNFVVMGSIEAEIQRLVSDIVSNDGWTLFQLNEMLTLAASAHQIVA